jgi:hypothetical protein
MHIIIQKTSSSPLPEIEIHLTVNLLKIFMGLFLSRVVMKVIIVNILIKSS